jgi:hypothetical protein
MVNAVAWIRAAAILAGVLSALVLSVGTASAATSLVVAVSGSFSTSSGESGPVGGQFSIARFVEEEDGLAALGSVTYSLCIPGVDPQNCVATLTQPLSLRVLTLDASCGELELTLASSDITSPFLPTGFVIHLDPASVNLSTENAPTAQLLCALGHQLDVGVPSNAVAPLLTQVIRSLD